MLGSYQQILDHLTPNLLEELKLPGKELFCECIKNISWVDENFSEYSLELMEKHLNVYF